MDKKFWAVVSIIIVLFVGFLVLSNNSKDTTTTSSAKPTNHVRGNGTKVALVEYGDFQCPACSVYYEVLEQVYAKYSNDMTMQFRHFPLTSLHPNAFAASRAAEAASKQGKFWEMYSKIYSTQAVWQGSNSANSIFESYATELGLDITKYKADFKSSAVNDSIKADVAAGQKINVTGTPTFLVNGKVITTPAQTVEAFSAVIDKALAESNQ